jgi:hypothetical protein
MTTQALMAIEYCLGYKAIDRILPEDLVILFIKIRRNHFRT